MTNETDKIILGMVTTESFTFEDKLKLSNKIAELLKPLMKERSKIDRSSYSSYSSYDDDDDDDDNKIKEKINKIKELKNEKEKKILIILGQMFNGVIVPEKLSIRRGEFYRYRCQYSLNLESVKQELLNNLHSVGEKITNTKNLDILEFCLNEWNDKKDSDDDWRSDDERKDYSFKEIQIIEDDDLKRDDEEIENIEFIKINGVSIFNNGKIKFFHLKNQEDDDYDDGDDDDDDNKKYKKYHRLQLHNHKELLKKYDEEITKISKEYNDKLDEEIDLREKDLKTIKEKGSHLLISAELQKGNDDIKGWGNE